MISKAKKPTTRGLLIEGVSLISGYCKGVDVNDTVAVAHLAGFIAGIVLLFREHLTEDGFWKLMGELEDILREGGGEDLVNAICAVQGPTIPLMLSRSQDVSA